MESTDPARLIEAVSRRADLLSALRERPLEKSRLAAELPVSRSTVDRAVRRLESFGLVTRDRGAVSLTLGGRLALSEFEEFRAGIEGLMDATGVLAPVPPDSGMDLALFRDATVVSSHRYAPHQPVQEMQRLLTDAGSIRGVASAVLPEYVDLYSDQILEQGTDVELVVPDLVLETLVTDYWEELAASLETGRLDLKEVGVQPPFSAIIARHDDPELGVVIYAESGTAGVIRNAAPEAIEWARDWIETWEERAEPIRSAGLSG